MDYSDRIFNQAVAGSPINNGLPPALASLVVAQAKHETGDFTSNFFKNYNNAFGYSYTPASKYQSAAGTAADNNLSIGVYENIEDSTKELIDWIYRRRADGSFPPDLRTITTPEQYATYLKAGNYYTDSIDNYAAGLKRFFIRVFEVARESASSLYVVLALGALAWFMYRKKRR